MKSIILIAVHVVFLAGALRAEPVSTNNPTMTFSVTTTPTDGKYAPRHVLAIWVTDSQDALVRTLFVDANKRKKHLVEWIAALCNRESDAVTGATRKAHQPVTVTWNCTDAKGKPVPDGIYRLRAEFTEINGRGPVTPKAYIALFFHHGRLGKETRKEYPLCALKLCEKKVPPPGHYSPASTHTGPISPDSKRGQVPPPFGGLYHFETLV